MQKVNSVDSYIALHVHYAKELTLLRNIIKTTELEETIKWSMPTYCLNGKHILGIGAFKNHFCLWFHQGVFLKDEHHLLINAQKNKTKALRQMRFETEADIVKATIYDYVKEAIVNQQLGREIKPQRKPKILIIPVELSNILKSNTKLTACFKSLSLSKQSEYCDYITDAKRASTKHTRLDKITPMILNGVGLNDKYKRS